MPRPVATASADVAPPGPRRVSRLVKQRPPGCWSAEIEAVLITQRQLARRVRELSRQLERDYEGKDLVMVSVFNGTVFFLPDLIRNICLPLRLDFIGVSSYGVGTRSGKLRFTKELRLDVAGRDVLVVDDILDTGNTLSAVVGKMQKLSPRSLQTCVLLDKPERREAKIEADYVGFTIPNLFVVGYGLDYAEKYRNLPFIGVMREGV